MPSFGQIFRNMPPVTKNLILINLFIYLIMALMPAQRLSTIDTYLALHYIQSPMFNPAQLFTYMFLHGGFAHVFFNMFSLFMFGTQIEYSLGSRRFLFYYISCGIGAALVQEGVYALMIHKYVSMFPPEEFQKIIEEGAIHLRQGLNYVDPTLGNLNALVNGATVGASGAVYGVLLAYGMLFPNHTVYLMIPPMPIKAEWLIVGFVVIELLLGISNNSGDNVAHFCHLGGMLIGFLILLFWRNQQRTNGFN